MRNFHLKIFPLKAKFLDKDADTVDLEKWAKEILFNPSTPEKVMFIQGEPGRGKSIFCRMFADWVHQHLHPIWTPILICLKDIDSFKFNLESTFISELKINFLKSNNKSLSNKNIRFLFILDGLDELQIEARNNCKLEEFIKQVAKFQQKCNSRDQIGHRVLITGNKLSLQSIAYLPSNLERVEIIEMDGQIQQTWWNKWEALQLTPVTVALRQFLQGEQCSFQVQRLVQEPLLLYLLAAMYRDGTLTIDQLKQTNQQTAKIVIYQEALNWVITKHFFESDRTHLNISLAKQGAIDLKRILTEAAVCVVYLGGKFVPISMLKERLEEDETAKVLIVKVKEKLENKPLKTALATFDIRPLDKQESGVEFPHKSFSEFLFAEHLKVRLKAWTRYYETEDGRQLITPDIQMNWQIYDLLGFGRLTPEVMEYVMGLLTQSQDFSWEHLFRRLENFYHNWCQGKFIDSAEETLPQKKLRQLQKYQIQKLGQRQVDIYTGLNVMILLLELHRYAQERDDLKQKITFYPSGQADGEFSWTYQLLRIINYSDCIQSGNFNHTVGQFLSNTNLSGAILSGVNLSNANLRGVDLSNANLSGAILNNVDFSNANLSGAIFSSAILSNAILNSAILNSAIFSSAILSVADLNNAILNSTILSVTDLNSADLSNADLRGAILRGAILSNANVSGADLSGVDLSSTVLRGAIFRGTILSNEIFGDIVWDENTNWQDVQGLDTAINVPEDLKQQLGLD